LRTVAAKPFDRAEKKSNLSPIKTVFMDTYRDMLLEAYYIIDNTTHTLFNVAFKLCLMEELEGLEEWLDEVTPLPIDILDTMKDPLVLKMSGVVHKGYSVLEILGNLNAFTEAEITYEVEEKTTADLERELPVITRAVILKSLIRYYYEETCIAQFYLGQMCYLNGYHADEWHIHNIYDEEDYGDANVKAIAAFCRMAEELQEYMEATEISPFSPGPAE
jgi:hypothetical protein